MFTSLEFLYRVTLLNDVVYHIGSGFCRTKHVVKACDSVIVIEEFKDKLYVNVYDSFSIRVNKMIPKSAVCFIK